MTKNEIFAKWMGHKPVVEKDRRYYWVDYDDIGELICYHHDDLKFHKSPNWLMPAWVKFRDLKFDYINAKEHEAAFKIYVSHQGMCKLIESKITKGTITEAFDELCKGIEWVESLKK